jgi:hypothetical protein
VLPNALTTSFCNTSLAVLLLAARGWEQFKTDVLEHVQTDQDEQWEFLVEGILESFPQLAIGQVRACR